MSDATQLWFDQPGLFVLPIEHLTLDGVEESFRGEAQRRTGLSPGWFDLLDASLVLYAKRTRDLADKDPRAWFPPRVQHVCVVTDAARVRPYFQPFHRSAWLLYSGDFDPACSNPEFGAFMLVQVERMGLLQQVGPALSFDLAYWLGRDEAAVLAFQEGAAASIRPDAAAYRALGEALPWIRRLAHPVLSPPLVTGGEPTSTLPGAGLLVPRSRAAELDALLRTWAETAAGVAERYRAGTRAPGDPEELCAWLAGEGPPLLVTGEAGQVLWDPERPDDFDALGPVLAEVTAAGHASLRADLAIVAERSGAFLASLTDPAALPAPDPDAADQNGLSYMHLERRLVAYNLAEPGMHRRTEPAPPYERAMLAARTIHEWGHLATTAGWIPVPAARQAEHAAARAALAERFEAVLAAAPSALRRRCAPVHQRLARHGEGTGEALVRFGLSRVEDFQSNLLSQRYLTQVEREVYVRNNLRALVTEFPPEGLFAQLARHVYEAQYLRFSVAPDPAAYLLRSTWFGEQFLQTGALTEADLQGLLTEFGALLDTFEVDQAQFA